MPVDIILQLPFPLTVNSMYKNVGRKRAVSKRYAKWKTEADVMILRQKQRGFSKNSKSRRFNSWRNFGVEADATHGETQCELPICDEVEVIIMVERIDRRKRDIDNLVKCCLDALVRNKIITDDCKVQRLTIEWGPVKGARVKVRDFVEGK